MSFKLKLSDSVFENLRDDGDFQSFKKFENIITNILIDHLISEINKWDIYKNEDFNYRDHLLMIINNVYHFSHISCDNDNYVIVICDGCFPSRYFEYDSFTITLELDDADDDYYEFKVDIESYRKVKIKKD